VCGCVMMYTAGKLLYENHETSIILVSESATYSRNFQWRDPLARIDLVAMISAMEASFSGVIGAKVTQRFHNGLSEGKRGELGVRGARRFAEERCMDPGNG
jgi:hypothetical protein